MRLGRWKYALGLALSASVLAASAIDTSASYPNPMSANTTYGQTVDLCGTGYQWGNAFTAGYAKILNYGSGNTNCRLLALSTYTSGGHEYDNGASPATQTNQWIVAGSSIAYDSFNSADINISGLNGYGGRCDWFATNNYSGYFTSGPGYFSYSPGPGCSIT